MKFYWKLLKTPFILITVGAGLMAIIWNLQGWAHHVFGWLAVILMLVGFLNMKFRLDKLEKESELETFAEDFEVMPQATTSENLPENPKVRWRILWICGMMAVGSFILCLLGKYGWIKMPFLVLIIVFVLGLASAMILAFGQKGANSHDIGSKWASDKKFRSIIVLFVILMFLSLLPMVFAGDTPIWSHEFLYNLPCIVVFFALLFGLGVYLNKNLSNAKTQQFSTWSVGENRLDNLFSVLMIGGFFGVFFLDRPFFSRLVEEFKFWLIFTAGGFLLGWILMDFLKTHLTEFFKIQTNLRSKLILRVYVVGIFATLAFSVIFNHRTAKKNVVSQRFYANQKTSGAKNQRYLFLDFDGKEKRFSIKNEEWEKITAGDSVQILVGHGILGFDVFLEIQPK